MFLTQVEKVPSTRQQLCTRAFPPYSMERISISLFDFLIEYEQLLFTTSAAGKTTIVRRATRSAYLAAHSNPASQ